MSEWLVIIALLIFYFIPMVIAYSNDRKQKAAIALVNVFLGWTVLGWFAALIWATVKD